MIGRAKKGLTLIEVIISMAILAIIVSPILSLSLTTTKTTVAGDNKLKALAIAQEAMEEVKSNISIITDETKSVGKFKVVREVEPVASYAFDESISEEVSEGSEDDSEDPANAEINYDLTVDVNQANTISYTSIPDIVVNNSPINTLSIVNNKNDNVKVKVNLTEEDEDEETVPLVVNLTNNIYDKNLEVYFVKESSNDHSYLINSSIGKVKIFSNVFNDEVSDDLDYRLYRVTIKVFRDIDNEAVDQPLQILEGYKTFLR